MADAPKRSRPRSSTITADKNLVANRVVDFYTADIQGRTYDMEARLQRYAKFRNWTEPKNWPWEDCTIRTVVGAYRCGVITREVAERLLAPQC